MDSSAACNTNIVVVVLVSPPDIVNLPYQIIVVTAGVLLSQSSSCHWFCCHCTYCCRMVFTVTRLLLLLALQFLVSSSLFTDKLVFIEHIIRLLRDGHYLSLHWVCYPDDNLLWALSLHPYIVIKFEAALHSLLPIYVIHSQTSYHQLKTLQLFSLPIPYVTTSFSSTCLGNLADSKQSTMKQFGTTHVIFPHYPS